MKKKILHVEDEIHLRKILSPVLEKAGYEVLSAADGETAIKMFEKEKPDMVILDLILPKKNGFEILEAIRAKETTNKTPVIILTNLEEKYDIEKTLSYGVRAYLVKANYRPEEIVEKVKEILK